jgi:hypothetical protein
MDNPNTTWFPQKWGTIAENEPRQFGILIVDIVGHSQLPDPPNRIADAKSALSDFLTTLTGFYGGAKLMWAGDGGVYLFLIQSPEHDAERMVHAALQIFDSLTFFNERLSPLVGPLNLRVILHLGILNFTRNRDTFHGKDLNKVIKWEKEIGQAGTVTITQAVFELLPDSIRREFDAVPPEDDASASGTPTFQLYRFAKLTRVQKRQELQLLHQLFQIPDDNRKILVLLPSVTRARGPSLKCDNYPLYNFELSPDDAKTALKVYPLLMEQYGKDRVEVRFCNEERIKPDGGHLVLIGSSVTNLYTDDTLRVLKYSFGSGSQDHDIIANGNVLKTHVESRKIVQDFALFTRRRRQSGVVEIVLAGCRAYGQEAFVHLLSDSWFYSEVLPKISRDRDCQVLIEVRVRDRSIIRTEVKDVATF